MSILLHLATIHSLHGQTDKQTARFSKQNAVNGWEQANDRKVSKKRTDLRSPNVVQISMFRSQHLFRVSCRHHFQFQVVGKRSNVKGKLTPILNLLHMHSTIAVHYACTSFTSEKVLLNKKKLLNINISVQNSTVS